ncbi:DUF6314 family protein [Puniceibacterium sp. IMCC21224]|uniref:DUF6314 family protein n=1 Tax=Puniceibacterium sp. IMCC21224 TaxID=1618204 RepID=UPI00064DD5D5|nr:DUF6314 family protein [Puniceibacterium sp. IMCC21224]KMK66532.1 hypothetical protein IMCC21224_111384 [Puniceibacterium sp. IMCC21224]
MGGPHSIVDFTGRWTLRREIADRQSGRHGQFDGDAEFLSDEDGLSYVERGQLRLEGQGAMTAERRYLWRATPSGVAVHFADGAAFHSFALGGGGAEAAHWCDPDQYDVTYEFQHWPRWRSIWEVRGPRKDYRMVSVFER